MKTEKYYNFEKNGDSCVILSSNPPRHWYNYLWSEDGYCAQISQMGHGKSYYINSKAEMCMVNNNDAKYIYIRDEESKEYWNIGEGPLNEKIDNFSCEHHLGYTKLQSEKNGIQTSWRLFVPHQGYNEVWTLRIENKSKNPRELSIFSTVSFELDGFVYPRYYEMYRSCETIFDEKLNGIYCKTTHPFTPHSRYNGYIASSEPVYAYDGNLAEFLGTSSTLTKPDASTVGVFQRPTTVTSGVNCTNSNTSLFILGGVLQNKFFLQPGEVKEINLIFGISESLGEARETSDLFFSKNYIEDSLNITMNHVIKKYSSLCVKTPNIKINNIMNNWLKKQIEFCVFGKKGVRDNLQIAVALLNYMQDRAKAEIIECLRHQFKAGHAVLTWYPYDDTRYSDQPFWIIWAVCELIKETGDYSLLDMDIAYQDGGNGTMLEHVKAAVKCLIDEKGANNLVKIKFADWNDALNIITDPDAESVMLSEQFCLALYELAILMEKIGENDYSFYLMDEFNKLKNAINLSAWDGEWYVRALSNNEIIGSCKSEGSKIYLNAQTWAVLADIADNDRLSAVIHAIDSMEHDFGFPLNMPPYEKYSPNVGRMSGMLPGLFENGGVYCHATGFKILMDCKVGRGDEALKTLLKIMPDSEKNPSCESGAEPYVFTNCYSTNSKFYGKSYGSWTTGTSAWSLMGLYEGIFGIKRSYDGLIINPCFPSIWSIAEVYREFRGARYHITIHNPENISSRNTQIWVDGQKISGNILPFFNDNDLHEVIVKIER